MKKNRLGVVVVVMIALALSTLACSLSGLIPGSSGDNGSGAVADLWPDVPKMGGMTIVQMDMPIEIRLMVQSLISTASGGDGSINFVAYTTSSTPAEVETFYNSDRMTGAGWKNSEMGCIGDPSSTTSQGGLCVYGREKDPTSATLLAIIPAVDDATKKTQIFFARIDLKNIQTPTP